MTGESSATAGSVDEVLALYARWGSDHYDEELSQLDHALQTAALAVRDGASDELIVAALLHDVGHLLELERSAGATVGTRVEVDLGHEALGARYLSTLLPAAVTAPITLHVRAKRYRCAVDSEHRATLSSGSARSLVLQGGPMAPAEVATFESNPGFDGAVALRGWDDGGKIDGLDVAPLDTYRVLLEGLAGVSMA